MELREFQNAVANGKKIYVYHKLKPFGQQNDVDDKEYVCEELCYKNKPIARATLLEYHENGTVCREIISKLVNIEEKKVIFDLEKSDELTVGKVEPFIDFIADNLLVKLDRNQVLDIKTGRHKILFLGDALDKFNTISRIFPNEAKRQYRDLDGKNLPEVEIFFPVIGSVVIESVKELSKSLKGIRYDAIIAPRYTKEELEALIDKCELGAIANYLLTRPN